MGLVSIAESSRYLKSSLWPYPTADSLP